MSNYFAHPLGEYAQRYIDGVATPSELPHTYSSHGFSKIDFGVGGGHKIYSMTNGVIQNVGWFQPMDDVSKYGCVVRTTDCGYSRMQAKLQGGSAEDYPVFFTYIEMDEISPDLKVGNSITKGTYIGITNNEYAGSNWHFDIQPWERYGGGGNSDKAQEWWGAISLDEFDAYGHKGQNYQLKDHLDSHFSLDDKGNLKDYAGKYIGKADSNGIYYPIGSSGEILTTNTGQTNGLNPDLRISRWYSYAFMMQTPFRIDNDSSNFNGSSISSLQAGWHPSDDSSSTGIEGYFSNGMYTFPIYKQARGPWASMSFWDNKISSDGCSISSCAIITSGLTQKTVTPPDIITAYLSISGASNTSGFLPWTWRLGELAGYYGCKSLGKTLTDQQILDFLSQKIPVAMNIKEGPVYGNGYSTNNGHLITLLDYDANSNKVFLGDPAWPSGWFDWQPFTIARGSYSEAISI